MADNADTVRRFAEAFDGRDTESALACLDEDVDLQPLRAQLEGATYRGHEGYLQVVADLDEDWEDLRLHLDDLREGDGVVVAVGRLTARGRASGVDLDVPLALLYEFRNGRIVRLQSFSDPATALATAGIDE